MNNKIKLVNVTISSLALVLFPLLGANATSTGTGSLQGSVITQQDLQITINSITATQTSAMADGIFENGWKWTFDVTIPQQNETQLAMKLQNWISVGTGNHTIPVANNARFYSPQSSNAVNGASAITITAADTYSSTMFLIGDLDSSPNTRRINITVEARIPVGSQMTTYSNTFGIRTLP